MTSNSEAKEDASGPQQDSEKGKVYIYLFEMQPSPSRKFCWSAAQRSICFELLVVPLCPAGDCTAAVVELLLVECGAEFFVEGGKQNVMDQFKFWEWVLQLLWTDMQYYGDGTVFTLWDKSGLTDGILQRGNPRVKLQRVAA